jgi:MATE family multidrug resistance protein
MQVAQTAERMKRWGGGGQDIDTDQKKEGD